MDIETRVTDGADPAPRGAPRVAAVMREVAAELASGHVRSFEVLLAYGPPGAPRAPRAETAAA